MILFACLPLAFSHGGEDHGTPAPVVDTAHGTRVPISSSTHDAVLVADGTRGTLLVAHADTSVPHDGLAIHVTLTGPSSIEADLEPVAPGVYGGDLALASGTWAGSLVITAPDGSADLLAVNGLLIGADEAHTASSSSRWIIALAILVTVAVLLVLVVVRQRRRAALALLLIGAIGSRAHAHGGEDHGAPAVASTATPSGSLQLAMESQFLLELRTERVTVHPFQPTVRGFGSFVAPPGGAAEVAAPVTGIVRSSGSNFPRPGDTVRAGDVLLVLQETPAGAERAALAQERADAATRVDEATAALALAERDAGQVEALGSALSPREVQERVGRVAVARGELGHARTALQVLEGGVSVTVKAPLSGRLAAVRVNPGDGVSAGDPLFRVVAAGGLWLEASVPERYALDLQTGGAAQVLPFAMEAPLTAIVLDAGQEADPGTGSVRVTLALDAPAGLKPGMGATAFLPRGTPRNVLQVPDDAVVESGGLFLAFVKTGPETFEIRELRIGERDGSSWEVEQGLEPGDRVVVAGTTTLKSLAGR